MLAFIFSASLPSILIWESFERSEPISVGASAQNLPLPKFTRTTLLSGVKDSVPTDASAQNDGLILSFITG